MEGKTICLCQNGSRHKNVTEVRDHQDHVKSQIKSIQGSFHPAVPDIEIQDPMFYKDPKVLEILTSEYQGFSLDITNHYQQDLFYVEAIVAKRLMKVGTKHYFG